MHFLSLDTNAWIYLANGTEPIKLLTYIKQEVDKNNIKLLVPEIIIEEWNRNKDSAVKEGVIKHYKDIGEALSRITKLLIRLHDAIFIPNLPKFQNLTTRFGKCEFETKVI